MITQTTPTTSATGLLGGLSEDMDQAEDLGGSTPGQSSSLSSALIEAIVEAFERIMSEMSGESQGGSFVQQDSGDASPFGNGPDSGSVDDPSETDGLPSQSGSEAAGANLSNAGPDAAPNLTSEQARRLSEFYNPGSDASLSPKTPGSQDGQESGSPPNQGASVPGLDQAATASAPAASAGSADDSSTGQAKSVDGAVPGDDTVDFKLVNTSNHNETIALVNSEGQKFDQEQLKAGASADVLLSANDPNTKSMREELENPDGSLQSSDAKIGESNIQDENGHAVVSNDVSDNNFIGAYGTDGHNVSGTQMTFSDNKDLTTGDKTANPPYQYAKDDKSAMNMANDTSQSYTFDVDG